MQLWEFLADLAADSAKLDEYNRSASRATKLIREAKLTPNARKALQSRDPAQIHAVLTEEGHGSKAFTMPAGAVGPTLVLRHPRSFKVKPQK